jgi:transcriptional regulator with XRE-family HTH domain
MLGAKLKELRKIKGLYQRHLAAAMDVDTAFICKIENEEKRISVDHILKLSKVLDADYAELLSLWLADKLQEAVPDSKIAKKAAANLTLVLSNKECA